MYHQRNIKEASAGGSPSETHAIRVRELLGGYSQLTEEDSAELLTLYRQLTPVELALLASDAELAPIVKRFRLEHRRETRAPFRQYAILLAIAGAGFGLVVYSLLVAL